MVATVFTYPKSHNSYPLRLHYTVFSSKPNTNISYEVYHGASQRQLQSHLYYVAATPCLSLKIITMAPFKVGTVDVMMRETIRPQGPRATPKTIELPAGHKKRPECRPLACSIILDQDQVLTLRDGTKIRADIYRPKTDEKLSAIVMWGPYGKSGTGVLNLHTVPLRAGIPNDQLSGYENFEG
jgi:predicted acyl esterase